MCSIEDDMCLHHSLNVFPRSLPLKKEDELSKAKKFVVVAVVNDIEQHHKMREGIDGVEHMYEWIMLPVLYPSKLKFMFSDYVDIKI